MTSDNSTSPNPYTRPGFLAAAALVTVLAIVGVVLGIISLTRDDSDAAAPSAPSALASSEPTPEPSETAPPSTSSSVCGLEGEVTSGTVTVAPETNWKYQSTTAYPSSATYGPAISDQQGIRRCFQRSPEGALFMAANAAVQGSSSVTGPDWAAYFLADGPFRESLLADATYTESSDDTRMSIVGFRMLSYEGEAARVDIAVRTATSSGTVTASAVYELIWTDGDWKLDTSTDAPISVAPIPDTAGYTPWME